MGDELTSLLVILKKVEECGGQATLSVTTKSGVTKTKLVIVSPPGGVHPPLQLKQLPRLQPHLQEASAVDAAAVQQRGQKSMLGQLSTGLPWLGRQHLLQQEIPPVLHWALIFHLIAPYAFIPHQQLTLGNAGSSP